MSSELTQEMLQAVLQKGAFKCNCKEAALTLSSLYRQLLYMVPDKIPNIEAGCWKWRLLC